MNKKAAARPGGEPDTVGRLLDAAERLFGELGYDGVGMRALAEAAQVNLGAATYHFGSKEALYIETFMRRFRAMSSRQLEMLRQAEAEAAGKPLELERIVECLMRPPFEQGVEHPAFNSLLARNLLTPPPFLDEFIHEAIEPNVQAFNQAASRALPGVPLQLIDLRIMFSMGAMLMFTVHPGRRAEAPDAKRDEMLLNEFIRMVAAGLQSEPAMSAAKWSKMPFLGPPPNIKRRKHPSTAPQPRSAKA
jgi:AcrR family transcriptional regulator